MIWDFQLLECRETGRLSFHAFEYVAVPGRRSIIIKLRISPKDRATIVDPFPPLANEV